MPQRPRAGAGVWPEDLKGGLAPLSTVLWADFQSVSLSRVQLCDPMDCGPPGSSVHGILQARILEWEGFPFSGDLPNPGIEPRSSALWADSLPTEPQGKPSPGEGHGSPLQYSCPENPMDRGAWWGYSPWGRSELDMTK